jgi:hypothetical protein
MAMAHGTWPSFIGSGNEEFILINTMIFTIMKMDFHTTWGDSFSFKSDFFFYIIKIEKTLPFSKTLFK